MYNDQYLENLKFTMMNSIQKEYEYFVTRSIKLAYGYIHHDSIDLLERIEEAISDNRKLIPRILPPQHRDSIQRIDYQYFIQWYHQYYPKEYIIMAEDGDRSISDNSNAVASTRDRLLHTDLISCIFPRFNRDIALYTNNMLREQAVILLDLSSYLLDRIGNIIPDHEPKYRIFIAKFSGYFTKGFPQYQNNVSNNMFGISDKTHCGTDSITILGTKTQLPDGPLKLPTYKKLTDEKNEEAKDPNYDKRKRLPELYPESEDIICLFLNTILRHIEYVQTICCTAPLTHFLYKPHRNGYTMYSDGFGIPIERVFNHNALKSFQYVLDEARAELINEPMKWLFILAGLTKSHPFEKLRIETIDHNDELGDYLDIEYIPDVYLTHLLSGPAILYNPITSAKDKNFYDVYDQDIGAVIIDKNWLINKYILQNIKDLKDDKGTPYYWDTMYKNGNISVYEMSIPIKIINALIQKNDPDIDNKMYDIIAAIDYPGLYKIVLECYPGRDLKTFNDLVYEYEAHNVAPVVVYVVPVVVPVVIPIAVVQANPIPDAVVVVYQCATCGEAEHAGQCPSLIGLCHKPNKHNNKGRQGKYCERCICRHKIRLIECVDCRRKNNKGDPVCDLCIRLVVMDYNTYNVYRCNGHHKKRGKTDWDQIVNWLEAANDHLWGQF